MYVWRIDTYGLGVASSKGGRSTPLSRIRKPGYGWLAGGLPPTDACFRFVCSGMITFPDDIPPSQSSEDIAHIMSSTGSKKAARAFFCLGLLGGYFSIRSLGLSFGATNLKKHLGIHIIQHCCCGETRAKESGDVWVYLPPGRWKCWCFREIWEDECKTAMMRTTHLVNPATSYV